jgi:uncharacterized protein
VAIDNTAKLINAPFPPHAGKIHNISNKNMLLECLIYLVAFGGAEYISHFVSSLGGIIFYVSILFSLIILATFSENQYQRNARLALGLVPLIRIMSLALPVMLELSRYIWYIVVSIPMLTGIITIMRVLKYGPGNVGLELSDPIIQFLIACGGFFLGVIGFYFLKPSAWVVTANIQNIFIPSLVLIIFTGFIEELAFRGVIQRAFDEIGPYWWIYVSIVYPVLQIGQGSIANCIFSFVMSFYFGYMVKYTKSIIGVVVAHGLINVGLYLVFPHLFLI